MGIKDKPGDLIAARVRRPVDVAKAWDANSGTLDARIYVDPDTYEAELERVFGHSWLFLGHESQIPKAGDYVAASMGNDSVVVARQKDGSIAAFLNVCRHRGMKLCRSDGGSARSFTCSYHGWTYDLGGRLVGVPNEDVLFPQPLDRATWSTDRVPLVESYKGLLFGNWDPKAPSFRDHIADVAWYLDPIFDGIEGIELVGGVEKWSVAANWKLGADQFVSDNFHFLSTHASGFATALRRRPHLAAKARPPTAQDSRHATSRFGHGIGFSTDPEWQEHRHNMTLGQDVVDYLSGPHRDAMVQKYGEVAGKDLGMGHGLIFPNFGFLSVGAIRVFQPKGPDRMEIWNYIMVPKHASPELKEVWRSEAVHAFGAAGVFEQDDTENWADIQRSLAGDRASKLRLNMQMGHGQESDPKGQFPGTTDAADTDAGVRAFYRRWSELMSPASDGNGGLR